MEGGWQADGKGLSVWDVYTNTDRMAENGETANVALNMYDRGQYFQDIALLQQLGVNAYRFSLNWPRILPGGTGTPNPRGIAYYRTLIADLDGLYDPAQYNDRLLLGLKGTMSEAELHVLKQRLHQGQLSKARRGELGGAVPIGYVRQPDGAIGLDPD